MESSLDHLTETGSGTHALGGDGETRLLRVTRPGQPFPILARMAEAGVPADAVLARLRREHELSRRLDPAWAVKPLDLLRHGAVPVLTLADPGGQPLSALAVSAPAVSAPSAFVAAFRQRLALAIRIAGALAQLHRRGILHGDLRPFNLLVGEDGAVRLTGFGRAADLSAPQRQEVERPVALLPYMAPEQSGRMNRPVDRRSDLYALGVTLYELFSGELPFVARDAIEWVHSHLARAPIPPASHVPDLPPAISAILLRLLAKTAEDRYQTADGLVRDLTHALQLWDAQGNIPAFPPGSRDLPEGLEPPPSLYGREEPVAVLEAAFDQVAGRGRMGIVLISGRSGVGKSAVVHALEEQLVPPRGLFAAGKFDQGRRDLPYASLAEAFRGLVSRILALPVPHRDLWCRGLAEAVGDGGALMTALIPNLALLIGEQPAVPPLPPQEAQNRFDLLFRRVLQLFARADHPLVLFLDDLQWLDRATLDLLNRLVADGGIGHLLLVGAYRSDEVGPDHPLAALMERIRGSASGQAGADIDCREITLGPLPSGDLRRMVADSLDRKPDEVAALAALLEERTGGNAFFAVQLLTALERSGRLWFDREAKRWDWDLAAVETARSGDSIATLMTERLGRFPARARDLLARLAALGASAPLATLALAAGLTEAETERDLEPVLAEGLILRTDGGYRFLHDRVQEGAYALVPAEERGRLHLDIARALHRGLKADLSGERLFALVGQYDRCLSLIQEGREREEVATLHLAAGHQAKAASAHGSALAYALGGLRLLEGGRWERRHRLAFALEHLQAECEFLSGDLKRAELRLLGLVGRAECPTDRAAITALLVTVYTAIDRSDRAIDACLAYLRGAGVDWPAHPPAALAQEEYARLRAAIGDRPINSLAALSAVSDPDSRATLDVLAAALPPAFFSDRNLVCLILCRMANLTLQHGRSDASALGFAYLGMMAGPYFGDYAAGYAFGRLGYDLAERQGRTRYRARVLMTFAYHVVPWTRDIRSERPLLLRAFEEAREAGDVTYGGFTSVTLVTSMLASGDPLATVQRTAEARLAYVRQVKFGLCADILTTQLQLLRALRGRTDDLGSFDGHGFGNAAFEARLLANPSLDIATCWHWIRTLQLRCIAGQMAAAVEAAERAEGLLWTTSGHWEMAEFHFHAALARAGAMDGAEPEERARHAVALSRHLAQLREWAGHSADSFDARLALVEAEAARTDGRTGDAMRGYDRAVLAARRTALPHVEALAHECAAGLYRRMGIPTLELACIREAADRYRVWGATAKVRQLARRYPSLAVESGEAVMPEAPRGFDGVDLASLLETLRTVSDQAGVEQLTTTLLTLVLEHAGASRGLLILARGERLRVEAEATTGLYGVSVRLVQEDADRFPLPHSIIHGAIRDQEAVIVDDTRAAGPLSADPYFQETEARSILCLPLVRRRRVVGLLHLENALATYAFTPQRVNVLTLLGAQAAASLETATLEEKDALLKEIHHRVKNNLQLVTSLLNLQSRRIEDEAVAALFADSRDRVRSMALVHESLYRLGNFAWVPMREHLESVCAHLLRAYSRHAGAVRLETEMDDLKLDLDRAVPCGLIVNELVSNALKHAFPAGRGGVLRVVLTTDGQDCRLSVRDDGVGLPGGYDPDRMDTVGFQLVSDLSSQLHGTLKYSFNTGAEFIVTFPLKGRNRGSE
ncbi:putative ATPase/two-component sensor histidine kinase [Azospirillum lipoferum]|uniref:AAA family ATPase n=1 Tax=Azospirillum lipoferum TaxID=193 RepID=A0A5A9GQW1_AZOLI|nr:MULTISPECIES: AAA family ATPase [Azospirillum]KAA0596202.1 AAA family ATPase [Azospirillum lipoferum]MCP1611165.1 putative ATPase/two-component sensor histidine kinase [Azospirillum lipoferum]MDW5533710.1 AAA family ATPase [Azospirillum sp. NL1]